MAPEAPGSAAGPTLAAAMGAINAVLEAATASGQSVAVAVTDRHGELVAFSRMDDGAPRWVRLAIRKAYTAAVMARPTAVLGEDLMGRGRSLADYGDDGMTTLPGGAPLIDRPGIAMGAGTRALGGRCRRRAVGGLTGRDLTPGQMPVAGEAGHQRAGRAGLGEGAVPHSRNGRAGGPVRDEDTEPDHVVQARAGRLEGHPEILEDLLGLGTPVPRPHQPTLSVAGHLAGDDHQPAGSHDVGETGTGRQDRGGDELSGHSVGHDGPQIAAPSGSWQSYWSGRLLGILALGGCFPWLVKWPR